MEKPLKILELRASNFKRLTAVHVRLTDDGAPIVVGGKNAAGKSSVLDAIESALSGAKAVPQDPVRHGARKGDVAIDLGELRVERTFTHKSTSLKVYDADGVPIKSPQGALDALCSAISFDPLAFTREDPKKQDETLKAVLGLDFADIEAARAKLYAERTESNREKKRLEAVLESMADVPPGTPDEEVSVADLLTEIERREAAKRANDERRAELADMRETADNIAGDLEATNEDIARLQFELKKRQLEAASLTDRLSVQRRQIADATIEVEALTDPDTSPLREQIATAEETNRNVRVKRERADVSAKVDALAEQSENATAAIESLDEEKADRLAKAEFPVDGLGFSDLGPTLHGVPLEQASQAEKLRLSVAICVSLNPRIPVMLVREGSFLDSDGMRLLAELARDHDVQLWIERVSDDGEGCTILIEDGAIRSEAAE